jgi:hypothetical protein
MTAIQPINNISLIFVDVDNSKKSNNFYQHSLSKLNLIGNGLQTQVIILYVILIHLYSDMLAGNNFP